MATAHRSPYAPPPGGFVDDIEKGHQLHEFGDSIIRQGFVRKVFGGSLRLHGIFSIDPKSPESKILARLTPQASLRCNSLPPLPLEDSLSGSLLSRPLSSLGHFSLLPLSYLLGPCSTWVSTSTFKQLTGKTAFKTPYCHAPMQPSRRRLVTSSPRTSSSWQSLR